MNIFLYSVAQSLAVQVRHRPRKISDEMFDELQKIGERFLFTTRVHDDGTVSLFGPTKGLGRTFPNDTARWRLLSEVCGAMATYTDAFDYARQPLLLPFTDDLALVKRCAALWRAEHADYLNEFTATFTNGDAK